jgi:endonuclease YncB( thermonuclease family)
MEFKKGQCIIYTKGRNTYAEMLLHKGLAIRKPNLQDKLWKNLFYTAQKEARYNQLGLWKDEIVKNCLGEIYK